MVELPRHLIESCGSPLQDVIGLSKAARFYNNQVENNQHLTNKTVREKDIELTYCWAHQSWENVSSHCFKQDYKQSEAFSPFYRIFYQEAYTYIHDKPIGFAEN